MKTRLSQTKIRTGERGSAMVESALIFIVFFATLFGIWDFGQQLFVNHIIVEQTRAAARWGAVTNPKNYAGIRNMLLYRQATDPPSGTKGLMGMTASNIAVSDPGQGTDNYRLVVVVSNYKFKSVSLFGGGTRTGRPITVTVPMDIYE